MPDVRYRAAFAEAYIRCLALAAGLNVLRAEIDDDGVDVTIRYSGEVGYVASPAVDVQVKSWSAPSGSGAAWHYDGLNEPQFNKLAGTNYQMPRFLAVLVVPAERERLADDRHAVLPNPPRRPAPRRNPLRRGVADPAGHAEHPQRRRPSRTRRRPRGVRREGPGRPEPPTGTGTAGTRQARKLTLPPPPLRHA